MGQDFFKFLPSEIMLNIFLSLPTPTTIGCKCVCKPWLDLLETPDRGMMSKDVFTYEYSMWPRDLSICNPITREYIKLACPPESSSLEPRVQMDTFGFGVSRMTGQYKLVRIFHEWSEWIEDVPVPPELSKSKCQVYNVGSGSWSGIASAGPFKYEGNARGAFLNGNIHWMVWDMNGSSEYGNEKSWTKEFVIRKRITDYNEGLVCPIKAFQNGDVLMALEIYHRLLNFSSRTKTIRHVALFGLKSWFCIRAVVYAPSSLPLKTLAMENVSSF